MAYNYIINTPKISETTTEQINVLQEPLQTDPDELKIPIIIDNQNYMIVPLANYEISGKIVAKNTLFDGAEKKLGPIDLGLIWGKLAEGDYHKYMHFHSSQRWLDWRYNKNAPYSTEYMQLHISHNHIIPASKNIFNALDRTLKDKNVKLKGYLVGVSVNGRGIWSSSLSREDTGNHSCEVFYVYSVQIGDKIYK
jgi:hypothetical protein